MSFQIFHNFIDNHLKTLKICILILKFNESENYLDN